MTQTWTPFASGAWRPQMGAGSHVPNYFDPRMHYGGAPTYWNPQTGQPSPFWAGIRYQYLDQNPDAVYSMFTNSFAGGTDAFSNWMRNQYGQVSDAYKAALSVNPDLTFQQYLSDFGPQGFFARYMAQAPAQRGVMPGPYGGGRVNWVPY